MFRRILSATHFEEHGGSKTTTLYWCICDLKEGEIYNYNFHDLEEVVKINLESELTKGERTHTIQSLFPYETFAEKRYREETGHGNVEERALLLKAIVAVACLLVLVIGSLLIPRRLRSRGTETV